MYKQLIIARKDLNMSPGKLAAQVSHASMAFLTTAVRHNTHKVIHIHNGEEFYVTDNIPIAKGLYDEWIDDSFTKVICGARNKSRLLKAIDLAQELGMREGVDYFIIRDACRTELEAEEEDGTTITCVGFVPMEDKIIDKIGKEYHLY